MRLTPVERLWSVHCTKTARQNPTPSKNELIVDLCGDLPRDSSYNLFNPQGRQGKAGRLTMTASWQGLACHGRNPERYMPKNLIVYGHLGKMNKRPLNEPSGRPRSSVNASLLATSVHHDTKTVNMAIGFWASSLKRRWTLRFQAPITFRKCIVEPHNPQNWEKTSCMLVCAASPCGNVFSSHYPLL